MSTPGDLLLYVVSAKRDISWLVFKRLVDTLATRELASHDNAVVARNLILRAFDSLAHWEVLRDNDGLRRIAIAPSSLVRLPTRASIATLCGSRSPETIDAIQTITSTGNVTVEITPDPGDMSALLPHRVVINAPNDSMLADFARSLGIAFATRPPAHDLACVSASLQDVADSLEWNRTPELNWSSADFDPEHNCFTRVKDERATFRLTRYLDPIKNVFRYYMWDSGKCAEIDPDWGRYLALQRSGFNVLYFDPVNHLLAVPRSLPLPRLLARAVALCSGSSPRPLTNSSDGTPTRFVVYALVPNTIADRIAAKLGQGLLSSRFDVQRSIS